MSANLANKSLLALTFIMLSLPVLASPDVELMINRLLQIDSDKYYSETDSGEKYYDSLAEYKEWESLYIKLSKYNLKDKQLNQDEAKKLLFMGFIARANSDAAISEAFSSDLTVIFNANKNILIEVMSELSFVVPSTCYYLSEYFGFEGKNKKSKRQWIGENRALLENGLGSREYSECMVFFK
ncbi:hypothetical protein ACJJIF_03015 [Microbulbifer sp. SSSA002]|uniref:hypothetical protein n=1 Tax=unclassified Microbulbifer TaxID=2619833 RepID=UPI0040395E2C